MSHRHPNATVISPSPQPARLRPTPPPPCRYYRAIFDKNRSFLAKAGATKSPQLMNIQMEVGWGGWNVHLSRSDDSVLVRIWRRGVEPTLDTLSSA